MILTWFLRMVLLFLTKRDNIGGLEKPVQVE